MPTHAIQGSIYHAPRGGEDPASTSPTVPNAVGWLADASLRWCLVAGPARAGLAHRVALSERLNGYVLVCIVDEPPRACGMPSPSNAPNPTDSVF